MKLPHNLSAAQPQDLQNVEELFLYWVGQGWSVFPLAPRSKEPYKGSAGVKDATRDPETLARWAKLYPDCNVGGSCAGKLVVDVDPRSGGKVPEDLPPTRRHYSGRGDGGVHLVYSLHDLQRVKSGANVLGPGVDVKTGANSYVVLPGSVHPETGQKYTQDDQPVVFVPDSLLKRVRTVQATGGEGNADVKSLLTSLLNNPPAEGGRNEWLTKVCGHYAKRYRAEPDLYWYHVNAANKLLPQPLDQGEVDKTGKSVWNTESSGHPERDFLETLKEESGWLVSDDYQLLTAGYVGDDKKTEPVAVQFADFDLKLVGVLRDPEDNSLTYDCLLQLHRDKTETPVSLEADLFGDARALKRRLASFGASVTQPDKLVHKTPEWPTKLHQYLQSQPAPVALQVNRLGWCEEEQGFLTFDGVLDANGPRGYSVARPNPTLRSSRAATQHYGTEQTAEEARQVLAEVCEFQDDLTVALFGGWWAANFAKHLVRKHVPLFPVCAVEAASGSGKTSGFFSLMVQLSGSTTGEGHYTVPTLRNALAANYNGLVWVDDLDEPQSVHELIRVLTAGGTLTKMVNQSVSVNYDLVGSLLLSGESLELHDQKATLDRCVLVNPSSPTDRKSAKGDYSQWNDVVEVTDRLTRLGGGASLAGHYVTAVLAVEREVANACVELRTKLPSGREGSRLLVLAVGSRLLDYLLSKDRDKKLLTEGGGHYAEVVRTQVLEAPRETLDASGNVRVKLKNDNTLTQKLLPKYLSDKTLNPAGRSPVATAYEEDDSYEVYVNVRALADWWKKENFGQVSSRTESENGLNQQLDALYQAFPNDVERGRRARVGQNGPVRRFTVLKGELAREVVYRSQD
ncbi:DNA primase/polymerase [Gordonia phage Ghobes]|uniref:DNA primase/polymerase n=1 Tax=Gordonia phage Ghobes TaxID=1887647 RepID=A0A1B3B066_9CAUD|nr:DNA polymerase/primase [Gordonia phage Ghobes]AOE44381.1 DNA primase/polymerase [Gordonia phage Ghobes]